VCVCACVTLARNVWQVLKGQEAGVADPLGVYDELGDHLQVCPPT